MIPNLEPGDLPIEELELLAVALRNEIRLEHLVDNAIPHPHAVANVRIWREILGLKLIDYRIRLDAKLEEVLRA